MYYSNMQREVECGADPVIPRMMRNILNSLAPRLRSLQ